MPDEIRLSQIVTTFGPGALVDLPRHSVIVSGLDDWPFEVKDAMKPIHEPRLRDILERAMKDSGRLEEGQTLSLYQPPIKDDFTGHTPSVDVRIFPEWFICSVAPGTPEPAPRRLVHYSQIDLRRLKFKEGTVSLDVSPVRFVAACPRGHIQDLDWRGLVHNGARSCQDALRLVDRGTTGDPRDISVKCDCGAELQLMSLYAPDRLGTCRGDQPWLRSGRTPDGCGAKLKLLTRGAVNGYFPQTLRLISLPSEDDELTDLVREWLHALRNATSVDVLATGLAFNPQMEAAFRGYNAQAIFDRMQQLLDTSGPASVGADKNPRHPEFRILASGDAVIGSPAVGVRLHAETLSPLVSNSGGTARFIRKLVKVYRLHEVTALFGFTRLEPPPGVFDDGIDEFQLDVGNAPLAEHASWLPAIEQAGEGVFLELDVDAVREHLREEALVGRDALMKERFERWARLKRLKSTRYRGAVYVFAHTLSHLLLNEIALECGYPSTALRERIYVLDSAATKSEHLEAGILIYTAGGGSQGTLGGLAEIAPSIPRLIERAVQNVETCPSDPLCAAREPSLSTDATQINGSACHGCLFIPETSCENRNMLLDRAYVMPHEM